jgi:hypothetical protein
MQNHRKNDSFVIMYSAAGENQLPAMESDDIPERDWNTGSSARLE